MTFRLTSLVCCIVSFGAPAAAGGADKGAIRVVIGESAVLVTPRLVRH